MAATTDSGISNSRLDGLTFTEDLCKAFKQLACRQEFTCVDLMNVINTRPKLDQYSSVFVINEGRRLPIRFRPKSSSLVRNPSSVLREILVSTLIVAFHVEEGHKSEAFRQLVDHLKSSPVPITVVAALN